MRHRDLRPARHPLGEERFFRLLSACPRETLGSKSQYPTLGAPHPLRLAFVVPARGTGEQLAPHKRFTEDPLPAASCCCQKPSNSRARNPSTYTQPATINTLAGGGQPNMACMAPPCVCWRDAFIHITITGANSQVANESSTKPLRNSTLSKSPFSAAVNYTILLFLHYYVTLIGCPLFPMSR